MRDLGFLSLLSLLTLACLAPLRKHRTLGTWVLGLAAYSIGSFFLSLKFAGLVGFTFLRLGSWAVFAFLPAYLILSTLLLNHRVKKASLILGGLLLVVGLDAFFIEPRWLKVGFHSIESPLIQKPLRVVSLADFQTDHIGAYERKALLKARALQPDLVVFPGDFIQLGGEAYLRESAKFNALLKEVGLKPRLGSFAVAGDVEWGNETWPQHFSGTGIGALPKSTLLDLGELELAGLTLHDSRVGAVLPKKKKFRIVFGHAPDFALHPPDAELLLAGHTHGGQVQIPFFGPLITLSQVPRAWAGGGMVSLKNGSHLIVSRGIGHERGPAPRLRFNCRPEIVVVDLLPKK